MKNLTVLFVLLNTLAIGQVATIEIKRQPDTGRFNTKDFTIVYPVVVTNSKAVDKKINFQIRDALLFPDSALMDKPVEVALDSAISTALVFMSYEITFNRNNILSLTVIAESCAAYCSDWQVHFNFNIQTGNTITTADIFKSDSHKSFKDSVFSRKVNKLINYKSKLKEDLDRKSVDPDSYAWAIEQVEFYCIHSISLEQFSLSDSEIEIFDNCEFPHVITGMQPVYRLNYSYSSISELLKPEWKNILMK